MKEFILYGRGFKKVDIWQDGCWINMHNPCASDLQYLKQLNVPDSFVTDIRDADERPRSESDGDWRLTILRVPRETNDVDIPYSTSPLGVISNGRFTVVLSYFNNPVVNDFIHYNAGKSTPIDNHMTLILRLIMSSAVWFLKMLKQINISINAAEDNLERRMRNDDLLKLRNLQKSLVYFNTGIRGNESLLTRLKTLYASSGLLDNELIEDVHIELQQALNTVNIYSNILTSSMEAFGSIISNNLNLIMKRMTSITIILQVPTLIASIYGMNVSLPFETQSWAFILIIITSILLAACAFLLFRHIKWF